MADAEWQPCPFCGEDKALGVREASAGHHPHWWQIYCGVCAGQTDRIVSREGAIAAWNRRAELSRPSRGEKLEDSSLRPSGSVPQVQDAPRKAATTGDVPVGISQTEQDLTRLTEIRDGLKNAYWDFESRKWMAAFDQYISDAKHVMETGTTASAPTHRWVKSNLGHGETMCAKCFVTNREAAVLGELNVCPVADKQGAERDTEEQVRSPSSGEPASSPLSPPLNKRE